MGRGREDGRGGCVRGRGKECQRLGGGGRGGRGQGGDGQLPPVGLIGGLLRGGLVASRLGLAVDGRPAAARSLHRRKLTLHCEGGIGEGISAQEGEVKWDCTCKVRMLGVAD